MKTLILGLTLAVLTSTVLHAHCDSLDGPVVKAAQKALASGDINLVLPWVRPTDEPAIRQAFARTVGVRALNPEARELADTWFYETLVRVHREARPGPPSRRMIRPSTNSGASRD